MVNNGIYDKRVRRETLNYYSEGDYCPHTKIHIDYEHGIVRQYNGEGPKGTIIKVSESYIYNKKTGKVSRTLGGAFEEAIKQRGLI